MKIFFMIFLAISLATLNAEVTNQQLLQASEEIIIIIENRDYNELAEYIHPDSGLRFLKDDCDLDEDLRFYPQQFREINNSNNTYMFGYDYRVENGYPIRMSLKDFMNNYIYKNWSDCDAINVNEEIQSSHAHGWAFKILEMLDDDINCVEYYFDGPITMGGPDFQSLVLVFKKENDEWFLFLIHRGCLSII